VLDAEEAPESVLTSTIDALGTFNAKPELEGERLLIRAINDRDGNGACTEGQAWAEVEAEVTQDKVTGVKLVLASGTCPVIATKSARSNRGKPLSSGGLEGWRAVGAPGGAGAPTGFFMDIVSERAIRARCVASAALSRSCSCSRQRKPKNESRAITTTTAPTI